MQEPATQPGEPAQQSLFEVQPGLPESMQHTLPLQVALAPQQSAVTLQAAWLATQHLLFRQLSPAQQVLPEQYEPCRAQHLAFSQVPAPPPPTNEHWISSEQRWPAVAVRQVPTALPLRAQ